MLQLHDSNMLWSCTQLLICNYLGNGLTATCRHRSQAPLNLGYRLLFMGLN